MQRFLSVFGIVCASAVMCVLGLTQAGMADDWVITKLRGNVFAFDGAQWERLDRGGVVSDNRAIRTTRGGRAEFQRDSETINIGGDTQIRISDREGKRYTIVNQDFGRVEIEAEKRNVQHFAVQTPFLVAVVKGTQFVVKVSQDEASVEVQRGVVSAMDRTNAMMVNVLPGQMALAGLSQMLTLTGKGKLADITDLNGNAISQGALDALQNNGNGNGNGNGGGTGGSGTGGGLALGSGGGNGVNLSVGGGNGVNASVGGGNGVNLSVGGGGGGGVDLSVGGSGGVNVGVGGDDGGGGLGIDVGIGGLGLHL